MPTIKYITQETPLQSFTEQEKKQFYKKTSVYDKDNLIVVTVEPNNGIDIVDRSTYVDRVKLFQRMMYTGQLHETMRARTVNKELTQEEMTLNPLNKKNLTRVQRQEILKKKDEYFKELDKTIKKTSEEIHNELKTKIREKEIAKAIQAEKEKTSSDKE